MGCISVDKKQVWEGLANSCPCIASACQGINAFLMTLIGFCLSNDALGFVIGYLYKDFLEFDAAVRAQCMGDVRLEIMRGLTASVFIVLILWFICVCFAWYAKRFLGRKTKKLEKEVEKLRCKLAKYQSFESGISSIVKIYIASVAKRCGLGATERVSFYVLEKKGILSLSERYALNPDYQAVCRVTYPVKEGIISLARRSISAMVEDLPDYEVDGRAYTKVSKDKFSLSEKNVRELTMKARFYYAYRFSSPDKQRYNSIAVIESMKPQFCQKVKLDEVFALDNDFVYNLVDTFKSQLPRPKISKAKEF